MFSLSFSSSITFPTSELFSSIFETSSVPLLIWGSSSADSLRKTSRLSIFKKCKEFLRFCREICSKIYLVGQLKVVKVAAVICVVEKLRRKWMTRSGVREDGGAIAGWVGPDEVSVGFLARLGDVNDLVFDVLTVENHQNLLLTFFDLKQSGIRLNVN